VRAWIAGGGDRDDWVVRGGDPELWDDTMVEMEVEDPPPRAVGLPAGQTLNA
jgi:hypothetical protein